MNGWISLHRSIINHWVFSDPDQLKAWMSILMLVNHDGGTVIIKGSRFDYEPGESLRSIESWGKEFGHWSKSKTRRFLKLLESDHMIELKNETITTRLSVCNYTTYQNKRTADEPQMNRKRDTDNKDNKEIKQHMLSWWNEKIAPLGQRKLKAISADRMKKIKARDLQSKTEEVRDAIADLGGFAGDSTWFSFDWIIKSDSNLTKLLEGNYARTDAEKLADNSGVMTDGFTTQEERNKLFDEDWQKHEQFTKEN